MPEVSIQQAFEIAFQHHSAGRLVEAEKLYRQILAIQPGSANVIHALGLIAHQTGRKEEAIEWIGQAIALDPKNAAAHSHLGEAYRASGRPEEAMAAYERALALQPDHPEARNNRGNVLRDRGALNEAIVEYQHAVRIRPDFAMAHNNLGLALASRGEFEEAAAAYRRALEIQPAYPEAHYNLSVALAERGRIDEALTAYRRAQELHAGHPKAHNNLAVALLRQGQLDEAIAVFRRALELQPDDADLHSNLVHALHLHPGSDRTAVAAERQRWNEQFCEPRKKSIPRHANDRNADRRLRIGYVSPDFCSHPVAFFFAPLLEAHDREQFEVFCYANLAKPDQVTERLRNASDAWRDVHAMPDAQMAETIRNDGIDILVDLAMHTGGNRLPVFARKPAPLQVSWLAYPGTTGVAAIDFRLSDGYLDPEAQDDTGPGGKIIRLPDCWCCYAPIVEFPAVGALPAESTGVVTFGSLNQFCKIHDGLLRSWASLLTQVPDSRLRMICPEGQARERIRRLMAAQGVAEERMDLIKPCVWADYIRLFEGIDIALDSFPCNGMTTTCHSLWMGLPVVTRTGSRAVSRAGSSLLHAVGLPELVARTEEDYVKIAIDLAGDLPRLAELRRTLRSRMGASVLMDAPRFARNVEAAYRGMWRQWCVVNLSGQRPLNPAHPALPAPHFWNGRGPKRLRPPTQ
jgi:predicted O-linked N-acetylglucosamine transferase (SPINDLY family)